MPVTCARCGERSEGERAPLTWVVSSERGRAVYCCATCSRENLRAMEARLDTEDW